MEHVVKLYEDAFEKYGDSQHAVLWPKGRQDVRFEALTRHIHPAERCSVLDYGCGLAHLKPFLDERYSHVAYSGADAVAPFVDACRRKHPDATFFHVQSPDEIPGDYDVVVSSGAFNILYVPDASAHRDIVFRILETLFAKARVYLSFNFMTDDVDYRQPGAHHQSVPELCAFVRSKLSRRLVLDQSYMPYEFTLTLWKDQHIQKPENVYGPR